MLLVYSWLKEYVDVQLPLVELANVLTMLGMEVEDVRLVGLPKPPHKEAGVPFSGLTWERDKIVVGHVDEVMPHPNADRLVLCRLNDGSEEHIVLTGAPNLYPYKGQGPLEQPLKVAYAREGAQLIDGHQPGRHVTTLKRMTIRGVESSSMICSEKELDISDEHEGVILLDSDAPLGAPLADYLGDAVFNLSIMPHMIHCCSVIGIAREVAARLNLPLRRPDVSLPAGGPPIQGQVTVEISAPNLNPRFVLGLVSGLRAQSSPYRVQMRLHLVGMRPINSTVDATNYVMLETGEPLHAFDYDVLVKRAGGQAPTIITRTARPGETLTTLDGVERQLDDFTELVCDTAGALSIAGVMGGLESEVTDQTRTVLLEGASWNFINIRRTVASQRMQSEAAYRFARNVHPALAETGVRLGLKRMAEWGGGTIANGLIDAYPQPYNDPLVTVSEADVQRLLGIPLSAAEIAALLARLEFNCRVDGEQVEAQSPPYRTDIGAGLVGVADVIEELARLKGYDSIPATRLSDELPPQRGCAAEERERFFQDVLVSMGLQEVVTYRLTSPQAEARLLADGKFQQPPAYVELLNPISEERRVMRRSLLASVLEVLERNIRLSERLALFEIGAVFLPVEGQNLPVEQTRLAIVLSGQRFPPAWDRRDAHELDFFDLKGIIAALLEGLHVRGARFEAGEHPTFHPAKCARLTIADEEIGWLGELHPRVKARYSPLPPPVLAADLDAEKLFRLASQRFEAVALPAYPAVMEDLALIVEEALPNDQVVEAIRAAGGSLLKGVELFDIFHGQQIGTGRKSLAYRLTYQAPNRTLTDAEVGRVRANILQALEKELGAKVRQAED